MTSLLKRASSKEPKKKQIKEKQVVTDIQVYDPRDTLSRNEFIDTFCRVLEGFECRPRIAIRRSYEEIDKAIPLLVLCHYQSRVGTDVDAATRDIVADADISLESVAVVVVLEKDAHALTGSRSIDQLLDEKYDKFGLIVDIAFGTNRTLYRCPLNDQGFSSLRNFIEKYAEDVNPVETNEGKSNKIQKQIKEKQVVTDIQVYDPRDTLSRNEFIDTFCRVLEGFECRPRIAIRRSYEEIDKAIPLLVLCHYQSRVGTDVDAATRDIVADAAISLESVAVVVVLEKDAHALTGRRSIDHLLDEKYDKFGLIVDIAFGTNRTLYRCPLNDHGFSSLRNFIEKYAKYDSPVKIDNEGKSNQIPRLQVYCQIDSDRVNKLYTSIGNELQGSIGEFEVFKLESILDRDLSEPLLAIVESQSAVFKEFMMSKVAQNRPTVLLILKEGCVEPTVVNNKLLHLVYVDENPKSENIDFVQTIIKQLGTLGEGELELVQDTPKETSIIWKILYYFMRNLTRTSYTATDCGKFK